MTTELRVFRRTAAFFFAFGSFFAASLSLSAAMTVTNVAADAEFTFQSPNDRLNANTYELVVNAGSTTTVCFPPSGKFNCFVYLKGSGTVTFKKPTTYNGGDQVTFSNGLAADSTVTVDITDVTTVNIGRDVVSSDVHYPVADVANMTFEQDGGKLVLTNKCTARVLPSSFEVASGAIVALQGTNPLGLCNSFTLTDYDVVAMTRDSIPNGCVISVPPGRTLGLKPANMVIREGNSTYKWNWSGVASYFDESFSIALGGKGAKVLCRNTASKLRLFAPVTGEGEVLFMPDSDASGSQLVFRGVTHVASRSTPVAIPVNTAAESVLHDTWMNKVSHWFDASDASAIVPFSFDPNANFGWSGAENKFDGNQIVIGWKDKVEGSGVSFYNKRIWHNYPDGMKNDYHLEVMPYLVAGGLNGKAYLSFGYFGRENASNVMYNSSGKLAPAKEFRRLPLWNGDTPGATKYSSGSETTITPKYCIMVFGSQQGGGKAILGDDISQTGNGNLARNDSLTNQPWLAYNGYSMMVDGVAVNPRSAKPSGGWQIVSLDMTATNTVINGLGNHNATTSACGGQNYAEIIFFDEAPTDGERIACEAYLAEKWGLTSTRSFRAGKELFSEMSGGYGATVKIEDYESNENNVTVSNIVPKEVTIAGNYRGTINIASGKTLVVSDRPAPPAPCDMPQQGNIAAWFDPSLDGATDPHGNADAAAAGGIARLYSRTAGDVDKTAGSFYLAMQGGLTSVSTRYPFLLEQTYLGANGIAGPMKWLDFTTNAPNDTTSNNLRSHLLPAQDSHITGTGVDKLPVVRSVFMAIDTSVGGGNPIADTVGMTGMFRPRNGTSAANPIWSANNTVSMTHTWLDTDEVNGTTTGFNGRAEVLGFEMSEQKEMAVFLAYYNQGSNKNYEHIGETMIYKTVLSDAERLTVQEYLMAKWTGDMNSKYSDLSGATVTGAGNVKSASLRNLPAFDAGFTGMLSGGSDMTFTVDSQRNASAAIDAITIDRSVTLDADCTVTVTLKAGTNFGTYTLLTVPSGSLAGKTFTRKVINETGMELSARLVVSDTTLALEIASKGGLVISIR
ncbi:MAG: hypothetical protein IJH50_12840 [Kiritimatiellae bacterium]|nr:hypothetical protein [Kiritimatiellia bacterium]